MENYRELLKLIINENLRQMVFSGVKKEGAAVKIRVRPVAAKG